MQIFSAKHKAKVAHEVHAQSLKGTHGLKLCVTRMTTSSVCPMYETLFFFESCDSES